MKSSLSRILKPNECIIIRMGCITDTTAPMIPLISTDSMKTNIHRLIHVCELEAQRQRDELNKLQKLLLSEFTKPIKNRSKALEASMIQSNLVYVATIQIYMLLQNQAKILHQHKTYFDEPEKFQHVKSSINTLLYCSVFIQKQDLIGFSTNFRRAYPSFPFPSDNDMDEFLRTFKFSSKVSPVRETQYVFDFCTKYEISSQVVNEAGHEYRYKA